MAKAAQMWPTIRVGTVSVRGWWTKELREKRVVVDYPKSEKAKGSWCAVHADQTYLLMIDLERLGGGANKVNCRLHRLQKVVNIVNILYGVKRTPERIL